MSDDTLHRRHGLAAIDVLEEELAGTLTSLTTEQLAEFWHGATEACTLRLVRLKPELVTKWPPEK